ncbi:MAG: sialidase family protein [Terriglobia bacterium]
MFHWRLGIVGFIALSSAGGVGCHQPAKSSMQEAVSAYRFEQEPRPVLKTSGSTPTRDPKLRLDASGAVYLQAVTGDHHQSQVGVSVSHDGGDSFAPLILLSGKEASVSSHGENSPSFVHSGWPYLYSLWERSTGQGGTVIEFARFNMATHQLEGPVSVVDKKSPSANLFPFMDSKSFGGIYAVWLDGRNPQSMPPGTFEIYLARSLNQGTRFEKNVRVSAAGCPCCRPVLAFGKNSEIYVLFRTVLEGDIRDIAISVSSDGGRSFSLPSRISLDNWKIDGCPHSGPSAAVSGDRLYVAWYTEGLRGKPGIWLAWSDDGAKSFSKPVNISGEILDANHPSLTVSSNGKVLIVFQGRDPQKKDGWDQAQVYLAEIDPAEKPSVPIAVPGRKKSVSYPTVASGTNGKVFVAWTEKTEEGPQVFLSRGRRNPI